MTKRIPTSTPRTGPNRALTEGQARHLEWLLTPPSEREPATKAAWSEVLGTSTRQLRAWEKLEHFRLQWDAKAKSMQGSPERYSRVLDALYTRATDTGDVQAAKLWLQALDRITPPTMRVDSVVTTRKQLSEITDEELARMTADWAAEEQARRVTRISDSSDADTLATSVDGAQGLGSLCNDLDIG